MGGYNIFLWGGTTFSCRGATTFSCRGATTFSCRGATTFSCKGGYNFFFRGLQLFLVGGLQLFLVRGYKILFSIFRPFPATLVFAPRDFFAPRHRIDRNRSKKRRISTKIIFSIFRSIRIISLIFTIYWPHSHYSSPSIAHSASQCRNVSILIVYGTCHHLSYMSLLRVCHFRFWGLAARPPGQFFPAISKRIFPIHFPAIFSHTFPSHFFPYIFKPFFPIHFPIVGPEPIHIALRYLSYMFWGLAPFADFAFEGSFTCIDL